MQYTIDNLPRSFKMQIYGDKETVYKVVKIHGNMWEVTRVRHSGEEACLEYSTTIVLRLLNDSTWKMIEEPPRVQSPRLLGHAIVNYFNLPANKVDTEYILHTGVNDILGVTLKISLNATDLAGIAKEMIKLEDEEYAAKITL